jgi:geranylgeranyl diphosphate synthase, type I
MPHDPDGGARDPAHRSSAPGARNATATLERCRRLVTPALRDTVDRLHPQIGRLVEFTLGWRNADGTPRQDGGGKGFRPALAVLSAEAVGAPADSAISAAVAVEMVHVFSLVHDDIMDGDEQRRHRHTAWKAFGIGPAVLAGDALLALAIETLARAADPTRSMAMQAISATLVDIVNGQAADLSFETRPWTGPRAVTVSEYSAMAGCKTGSLLGCAAGLGALLGGGPAETAVALTQMGRHLGLAFQAIDDLLGIWGDPAVTGKPVFSDLRQRKKSLPVVAALTDESAARRRLMTLLEASPVATDAEETMRNAADLIEEVGGRSFTAALAQRHLHLALRILENSAADRAAAARLTELSEFVITRAY